MTAVSRWLLAAAGALLLALAAPTLPLPGRDWTHLVVLDITQSMNTRDVAWGRETLPRLALAQRALVEALADMPCGSRVGLAVFSEYRSLPLLMTVEVCSHFHELRAVILRLDNRMSWAGASQVHKGLASALRLLAAQGEGAPSLLFVSDGHEAPPLRPGRGVDLGTPAGRVGGFVLGVGGDTPSPIPKTDPEGQPLGHWRADEVLQADTLSLGITAQGTRQSLVDEQGQPLAMLPGSGQEHLSTVKEPYLRQLAAIGGLAYARLDSAATLRQALMAPQLARWGTQQRSLRPVAAWLALLCLGMAAWRGRAGR